MATVTTNAAAVAAAAKKAVAGDAEVCSDAAGVQSDAFTVESDADTVQSDIYGGTPSSLNDDIDTFHSQMTIHAAAQDVLPGYVSSVEAPTESSAADAVLAAQEYLAKWTKASTAALAQANKATAAAHALADTTQANSGC